MTSGTLGRIYEDGDVIIRQGDPGDCMYVIQSGSVEVVLEDGSHSVPVAVLAEGDFFGEMALFEREVRSATVRARGQARILTVDRTNLLRRIHEDPTLAFRVIETLSHRLRQMDRASRPSGGAASSAGPAQADS